MSKRLNALFEKLGFCTILVLAFLIGGRHICNISWGADKNSEELERLKENNLYEQIIHTFEAKKWLDQNDPLPFMTYCEALVETKSNLPAALNSSVSPQYKIDFIHGYFDLLNGSFRQAARTFVSVSNRLDGRIWGNIGLIEYALKTERIQEMGKVLNTLESLEKEKTYIPSWVLPSYRAWHSVYIGDFLDAHRILNKSRKELGKADSVLLEITLLLRNNHLNQAETLFRSLPKELEDYSSIIGVKADLLGYKYGPDERIKYLSSKQKAFPKRWVVEKAYAMALLNSERNAEGLSILLELIKRRPFDLMLQIEIAEILLYFDDKVSGEIIKNLGKGSDVYQAPYYLALLSKQCLKNRDITEADKYIERARELSPYHPRVLWTNFEITLEKHDYIESRRLLDEILKLDPYEISTLMALLQVNGQTQKWSDNLEIVKRIESSGRYVRNDQKDQIKYYKSSALSNQGKH